VACAADSWRVAEIGSRGVRANGVAGAAKYSPAAFADWRTFLRNHMGETVAIDFFTVATIRLRVLFVFLVMEHGRGRVLPFGITEHPTAEWTGQQMVEAFWEGESKTYVIRDRDEIYGVEFRCRLRSLGRKEVISGFQSPCQNAYVERRNAEVKVELRGTESCVTGERHSISAVRS